MSREIRQHHLGVTIHTAIRLFCNFMLLAVLLTSCRRAPVLEHRENQIEEFKFISKRGQSVIENTVDVPLPPLPKEYFNQYSALEKEYRIASGDLLEVSLFAQDASYVRDTVVAPDGRLYYMFADGVPAEGRTLREVARDVEKKVAHLFDSPEVSVIPKAVLGRAYMVLGKVGRPGVFPLVASMTLRQAIGERL